MILDTLDRADRYAALHPLFEQAFQWLRQPELAKLPDGRHEIDGDRLYALVAHAAMRPPEAAQLEAHRRYIDIQYILGGVDGMGWSPLAECGSPSKPYDEQADIVFFPDRAATWIAVAPGQFVVYWPDDAHAPLVGDGTIHKIVIKVAAHP